MSAAEQIEQLYATSLTGPFPYHDCFRLLKDHPAAEGTLIPELDWYFATIAGYSHTASQLNARSIAELQAADELLSKSFFEHFPELEPYRPLIDPERTPDLHRQMELVEKLRLQLLQVIREVLSPVGDPAAA